ncbi:MAG: OmpA family protein [SAR324 cluster bacterium]|nr:OmpA family protein [SAR324 cluster bacterium]
MFRSPAIPVKSADEGEKPFWISYADLMTALMVLFLVVMCVTLLNVTRQINESLANEDLRKQEIMTFCQDLQQMLGANAKLSSIQVDCERKKINFGSEALFPYADYHIASTTQGKLRYFASELLKVAESPHGKRWLKRIIVEGFTDSKGSYLYNLDLSLKRSQSVLCSLISPDQSSVLTLSEKLQIQKLFLVGGFSSNSSKSSADESRRVEWKLDFYGLTEEPVNAPETYQLTMQGLYALDKQSSIPKAYALRGLVGNEYTGSEEFLKAVETVLGRDLVLKNSENLLEVASNFGRCQL